MITDSLDQLKRYAVPKTQAIVDFIAAHDCSQLPDGEMVIDGRELFVRIMSYVPKPAHDNRFEMHRVYADLQYIASGTEIMQTARIKDLTALTEYDKQGDFHFFSAAGGVSDAIVQAGEFTVFYPNQPHRTQCVWPGHTGLVKKLVFKIKV